MSRPRASVPPEAIRIEDEVWEEAFARREPGRTRSSRRLHAIDGGRPDPVLRHADTRSRVTPAPRVASAGRPASAPAPVVSVAADPALAPPAVRVPGAPALTAPRMSPPAAARSEATAIPVRRTVTIQGRGAERNLPWSGSSGRRPQRRVHERAGFKPDRIAMWAVLLGLLLVLVAVLSAHS